MVAEGVSNSVQNITVVTLSEAKKELTRIISEDNEVYCVIIFSEELYASNLIQAYVDGNAIVVHKKNMSLFVRDRRSIDLQAKALLPHKGINVKYILLFPRFVDIYAMTDAFFNDYDLLSDIGGVSIINFENVRVRDVEYKVVKYDDYKLLHVVGGLLYKRDYSTIAVISDTINYSTMLQTTLFADANDLRIVNLNEPVSLSEMLSHPRSERLLLIGTPEIYFKYGQILSLLSIQCAVYDNGTKENSTKHYDTELNAYRVSNIIRCFDGLNLVVRISNRDTIPDVRTCLLDEKMRLKIKSVSMIYNDCNIKVVCNSILEDTPLDKIIAYGYAHSLDILDIMYVTMSTIDVLVSQNAYVGETKNQESRIASCFNRVEDAASLPRAYDLISTGQRKRIVADWSTAYLFNRIHTHRSIEYYSDAMSHTHLRERFYASLLASVITSTQSCVDFTISADNGHIGNVIVKHMCAIVKRRNGSIGYIHSESDCVTERSHNVNVTKSVYDSYVSTLAKDGNSVLIRLCLFKVGFPGIYVTIPINSRISTYLAMLGFVFTSKPKYIELRSLHGSVQFIKANAKDVTSIYGVHNNDIEDIY